MEVESQTKAAYGEKNPGRLARRNGYRDRIWETRAGAVELRIRELRKGCYFRGLLEPRRMAEKALTAVVREAYPAGRLHPLGGRSGARRSAKPRVLDGIPAQARPPQPAWRQSGFLRGGRGNQGQRRKSAQRRLAALPRALHARCACARRQERAARGLRLPLRTTPLRPATSGS